MRARPRRVTAIGGARGIRERGAPHLTVMATPLSPDLRHGAPRSVELRCEAFVFFPSVDFYSRPREMRSGELPRLRPPRVESWRACRGGLEGAGKNGGYSIVTLESRVCYADGARSSVINRRGTPAGPGAPSYRRRFAVALSESSARTSYRGSTHIHTATPTRTGFRRATPAAGP